MKQDREQELMTRLSIVQKLSLAEAMELLGISESTARRMFSKLERDGFAIRTHGGVQCVNHAMTLYSFEYGSRTNIEKKTAIAREACKLLEDGDVVFCDSGTTIQCLCAEMVYRFRQEKMNIKVYTNSLANLELLSPVPGRQSSGRGIQGQSEGLLRIFDGSGAAGALLYKKLCGGRRMYAGPPIYNDGL